MTFSPPRTAISAITQASPCVITTATNHNLSTGNVVRLHVPQNYGMFPLNNGLFSVVVLSPTTFEIYFSQIQPLFPVDSKTYPAFVIPSNPRFTAEVLAVGSGPVYQSTPVSSITGTVVSDILDATYNNSTTPQPF